MFHNIEQGIPLPPPVVKTIRDEIYWQYAKLISKSAGFGINQRAFQMDRFMRLVWCDFKKLIEHDPTIVTNDFLSTLSAYQILVKSNRKLH